MFYTEMEKQKQTLERHNNEIAELREMVRRQQEQLYQQIHEDQSQRSSDYTGACAGLLGALGMDYREGIG